MTHIKVGRNVYEIQKGDYILDNGFVVMFCRNRHSVSSRNIVAPMSKALVKSIDFSKLCLVEKEGCKYYYF